MMNKVSRPSFNHTRADGPFDPCPECLALMDAVQLRDLVHDLRRGVEGLKDEFRKLVEQAHATEDAGDFCLDVQKITIVAGYRLDG
jgi:hypothetical protein